MRSPSFKEISSVLKPYSRVEIDSEPEKEGDNWEMYPSKIKGMGLEPKVEVVYLKSSATKKDIREAGDLVEESDEMTSVVFPPSLSNKYDLHGTKVKNESDRFESSKEYLKNTIEEEINKYKKEIEKETKKEFVNPLFKEYDYGHGTNPVETFLKKNLSSDTREEGKLGVILAEPGQGKTFTSEHVVGKIAKRRSDIVPILVESSQWQRRSFDKSNLWKTIAYSFKHFGAPIRWIRDNEVQFLESTLKAGIFRIVFDGFDEYILRNRGKKRRI